MHKDWVVHFRNTGKFKRIDSYNFTLKTRVRIKKETLQSFPRFYLMINCRNQYINFPLVNKGCENIVYIRFSNLFIIGEQNDLSYIGCDLEKWQELVIENAEKKVTVFLNNKKIFKDSYTHSAGKMAGFDYYFNCIGEIDYVSLYDKDNQLIYEDHFEEYKQ